MTSTAPAPHAAERAAGRAPGRPTDATPTSLAPTGRGLARRARWYLVFLGVLLVAAVGIAVLNRGHRYPPIDPRSYAADGAHAVVALLEHQGVKVELGTDPADLALAWLLSRPAVTAPIIGPRTPAHLDGALAALDVTLDQKALDRLDELFPGHRPAPEDYAW